MLGGLHTEISCLKTVSLVSYFLVASGWKTALVNVGIISMSKADSVLHSSHINRTSCAHQ